MIETAGERIWVDGCFDLGHFGHANLLRQAKNLGGKGAKLVVGLHSDAEIEKHKRLPIFNEQERLKMILAIKWVDEAMIGAPYVTTPDIVKASGCNFCVHGSDVATDVNGNNANQVVMDAGLYREVPRTQGISTTKLIKKVLNIDAMGPYSGSDLPLTLRRFQEFSQPKTLPESGKIIYTQGAFDLYHPGHIDFLEKVKLHGDYLIVGIYDDETVKRLHQNVYMGFMDRALTVLGCKYVDDVCFAPSYTITKEFLTCYNIDLVVHYEVAQIGDSADPYKVAKDEGKFVCINLMDTVTTEEIVNRILARRDELESSAKAKEMKEISVEAATKL